MHTRQETEVHVMAIIQKATNSLVGPDEMLTERLKDRNYDIAMQNLREQLQCGKIPAHINTPRKIANWHADCRCLKENDNIVLNGLMQHNPSFRLAVAA